jgi:hypothetical protein
LPKTTLVTKIIIHPRAGFPGRTKDIKIYSSLSPYKGDLSTFTQIATLSSSSSAQTFSFDKPVEASYLLAKASGKNNLHLCEFEVYGKLPSRPIIKLQKDELLIRYDTAKNTKITKADATDYQGDTLTYSLDKNIPFRIDSAGNIYVSGNLEKEKYTFYVHVSDASLSAKTKLTVKISQPGALQKALKSGDAQMVMLDELLDEVLVEIDAYNKTTPIFTFKPEAIAIYKHIKNRDYNIDWSKCTTERECREKAPDVVSFRHGLSGIQRVLQKKDEFNIDLFKKDGYRMEKLMILVGDKLREKVVFPMDKVKTDDNDFIASLLADYSVYNSREINPAQKDMGNFSRSEFPNVKRINKTIKMTSKKWNRSTGFYALPGETFKVTRKDSSNLILKVFVNTIRFGSTHELKKDGYKRPTRLKTLLYELKPNQTVILTSCYGGPIELYMSKNELPIEVSFEHVAQHPYWSGKADDDTFTEGLKKGDFDWAEIATSGFEVHSTLEKMKESVSQWGTAVNLAKMTQKYTSNYPHVLSGFKGDGIDKVDEIVDFATDHNIEMRVIDFIKHMNADQASCGYGCSGNPYDAYWAFSPLGHGDLHELGHGLEKKEFRLYGFEGHSTTNPYSYYTKSKYFQETGIGEDLDCQALPFKEVFEVLQKSVNQTDPKSYLATNLWKTSTWRQQFMFTLQAMMQAQDMGKLESGWHLLARLHVLQGAKYKAEKNWDAKKADLGFSKYSLSEFKELAKDTVKKNDYLLISMSFAAGIDYRPYYDMMGITYSSKASQQVESFGYPKAKKVFFASTPDGYCQNDRYGNGLDKEKVSVDGTSVYP